MLPHYHHPPSDSLSRPRFRWNNLLPPRRFLTRYMFLVVAMLGLIWLAGSSFDVGEHMRGWLWDFGEGGPDNEGGHGRTQHMSNHRPPHSNAGDAHMYRPPYIPPQITPDEATKVWAERKEKVREAFIHAWRGYITKGYPADEVKSVTGAGKSQYNGWALTLFDSLDTMWIMNLREEFQDAMARIQKVEFKASSPTHVVGFFETTIRYLGGLLSAYALSGEEVLKVKAEELGTILLPAFMPLDAEVPGERAKGRLLPAFGVKISSGKPDLSRPTVLFAEAATCQLEFKYLAKITGNPIFFDRAERTMSTFYTHLEQVANSSSSTSTAPATTSSKPKLSSINGLLHDRWAAHNGKPVGAHFTVGATADSGYEYLLKQWVMTGDEKALAVYLNAARGIIHNLIYVTSGPRRLMYAGDLVSGRMVHRMEHLSCFLGGLLRWGADVVPGRNSSSSASTSSLPPTMHVSNSNPDLTMSAEEKRLHRWAGEGLVRTCALMYLDQRTGLSGDEVGMGFDGKRWIGEVRKWEASNNDEREHQGEDKTKTRGGRPPGLGTGTIFDEVVYDPAPKQREYWNTWGGIYHLRPETIESLFYMYRSTRDPQWREIGWRIFESIERYTKVQFGYSTFRGVDNAHDDGVGTKGKTDYMPSWFLAETLKYLFLLFEGDQSGEPGGISLEKWVFNTEAHPLPIFQWSDSEEME